jgi:hypothetical protein
VEPLSEELVRKTAHELRLLSDDRIDAEMMRFGKRQPHLLSFIVEYTEDLEVDAAEVGISLAFVVYRMFQKGCKKAIGMIEEEEIIACFEENERLLERLEKAHERFLERIAEVQISPQPHVIMHVVDALLDVPDDDDGEGLSDEEIGLLFLLLKTEIDVLNRKTVGE